MVTCFLLRYFWECDGAGHSPWNRFICTGTLFGSRGKVAALEKLRISSPNTKKCSRAEHRSNRLAVIALLPRRARPEGKETFVLEKVNYSQGKCQLLVRFAPHSNFAFSSGGERFDQSVVDLTSLTFY